jgi:two-component system, NarL family, nitrate/nitrite response regulator NarL
LPSGLEATRQIHVMLPTLPVIALTAEEDPQYMRALLNAGACGYLLKTSAGEQLVTAIHQVCAGQVSLDPTITAALEEAEVRDLYRLGQRNTSSVRSTSFSHRSRPVAHERGDA